MDVLDKKLLVEIEFFDFLFIDFGLDFWIFYFECENWENEWGIGKVFWDGVLRIVVDLYVWGMVLNVVLVGVFVVFFFL